MPKKRNKFLTLIFSCLPGTGHMFMGFMKLGISYMSAFFFIIFVSSFFHMSEVLFLVPLVWFYSFFHCINLNYMKDEEFKLIEDRYLFDNRTNLNINILNGKLFGILLVLFGVYVVWNNIMQNFSQYIPQYIYNISDFVPRAVVGIIIIVIGARLIIGKKREGELDA